MLLQLAIVLIAIIIGGLYTRWGNTKGAFASLICGSGTAFFGFFCQRTWSSTIYPFLESNGLLDGVNSIFKFVIVVWKSRESSTYKAYRCTCF